MINRENIFTIGMLIGFLIILCAFIFIPSGESYHNPAYGGWYPVANSWYDVSIYDHIKDYVAELL